MKNFYYAVTEHENGKNYAYVIKAPTNANLLSVFAKHKNLLYANACQTKKQAENIVACWNECYKANGTYIF